MIAGLSIVTLLLALAVQVRLPALWGCRLELLPALVAYAALTFPRGGALALALLAGFLHDALSAGPFGVTPMVYGASAWLIHRLGAVLHREIPPLQMVAGSLVGVSGGVAGCLFAGFQAGDLWKLLWVAGTCALLAPLLFGLLDWGRYQLRCLR